VLHKKGVKSGEGRNRSVQTHERMEITIEKIDLKEKQGVSNNKE